MVEYRKALWLLIIQYFIMLCGHAVYSAFFCTSVQTQKVTLWSVCMMAVMVFFTQIFFKQKRLVLTVLMASAIASTYYIGAVLGTVSFAILIFLTSALILSIFLEISYIIIFGVISTATLLSFFIIIPETILKMVPNLYLYGLYVGCYIIALINIFVLVKHCRQNVLEVQRKAAIAEAESHHKSEFLANFSDEVRNPINAISGLAQIIYRDSDEQKIKEDSKAIIKNGVALLDWVENIINISKIGTDYFELDYYSYDIYKNIHDTINQVSAKIDLDKIRFISCINPKIPKFLEGDGARVSRVLYNLLDSAVKYLGEGEIRIDVDINDDITVKEHQAVLKIVLSNGTKNIAEDDLRKVNEVFTKSDINEMIDINMNAFETSLLVAKKMLELMNGTVTLVNNGKGSVMTVLIPQNTGRDNGLIEAQKNRLNVDYWEAPQCNVLIVDDNETTLKYLYEILQNYKIEADTAISGPRALDKMEEKKYDLVIMDYLMPGMDGVATLHEIRNRTGEHYTTVPVVISTTNASMLDADGYLKAGFNACLAKPYDMKALELILKRYLD